VLLLNGTRVADTEFPATARGYGQLLSWLRSFGRLWAVGVEGTGSYGAGLARHLTEQGVRVVEVNRPDRRQRRAKGKSDALDAYAAADAVLSGRACATPKLGTGIVEAIRALHTTRAGAVQARTAAMNELRSLLVTAPAEVRDRLRGLAPVGTGASLRAAAPHRRHRRPPGRGPRRAACPGAPPPGAHR
jgi:transposase